ncbi:MAG TPA: tetratricopeptide repeat protein [Gammaproteobacteria bacterium]|nr:tetratricopeptide repeat protein [Gammaproteobacteria bacterium]
MSMRFLINSLAGILYLAPLSVSAQSMTVIGGEATAQECYRSATLAAQLNIASRGDLESCAYALKHAPLDIHDRAATFLNRGIISAAMGEFEAAKKDYEKARRLAPEHGEIYVNRGNIFFLGQVYDKAVMEYTHALELDIAKKHIAHFNRALAYEKLGEFDKAETDYLTALELAPEWEAAKTKLTLLREKQARDT